MSRTDPDSTPSPAAEDPSQSDLERGSTLGRYLLLDELGQGGMGVVYKAFDPELGRPVALKVLRSDSANQSERLLREAQALARLSHPNVIAVFDVGTVAERVFIAMEFVEGPTLRQWLKQATRSRQEILDVFLAAGAGLAAAHRAGLVHRDFKPDNVLVGADGRVRVLDFGLARAADPGAPLVDVGPSDAVHIPDPSEHQTAPARVQPRSDSRPAPRPTGPTDAGEISSGSFDRLRVSLTQVGTIMGTPHYMAPEQHRGEPADERSDVFSFCVSLYEALYREFPYRGDNPLQLAGNVCQGIRRERPASARVPRWLDQVLDRGLAAPTSARFASMDALLAALRADPRTRRRRLVAMAVIALAAAVAVPAWRLALRHQVRMCVGAEAKLAGAWDGARRADVQRAFR